MTEIFRLQSNRSIPPWHVFKTTFLNPWIITMTLFCVFILYILLTWYIMPVYFDLLKQPTIQLAFSLIFLLIPFALFSLWPLFIVGLMIKITQSIFNLENIEYIGTDRHLEFISQGKSIETIPWEDIQDNIKVINDTTIQMIKRKPNIVTNYTRSGEVLQTPIFMPRYITNITNVTQLKLEIEALIKKNKSQG